jgi:pimeloyl-ACP methyl ester carboxylesterase
MNKNFILTLVVASLLGCESDSGTALQDSINTTSLAAVFNPSGSVIPFPNNLLFQGTTDGTLNIPVADANDISDPVVSMNALDGFSTVAPITTTFGSAIDAATIPGNVRVFEVTTSSLTTGSAVIGVVRELALFNGTTGEFAATVSGQTTLVISPLVPLKEKTSYMVVIKSGLSNTSGDAFRADTTYALTKLTTSLTANNNTTSVIPALSNAQAIALEPLRQLTNIAEAQIVLNASNPAIVNSDIILSWSFTTQSIGDVLANERSQINGGSAPAMTLVDSTVDSPLGAADIYVGTIAVPYYLDAASSGSDPTPLTSHWRGASNSILSRYNPDAVAVTSETIPLMVSVPKTGVTFNNGSIPVVIYQHGITLNRATILAVADTLAAAGYAVVAIDLPLHGLTGTETNGTQAFKTMIERTFDLDLVTQNATGGITAAAPDGVIDSSGRHFIQLASLLTSRDNVRQAVTDLFTVTKGIATMDVNGGGADFDAGNIYFLGHSLGAIVGTTFLALEPNVKDAVLAMPAGGIAKVLDGSASFGPEIAAGLAANGVTKGTADYESFMLAAQTVLDTTDPVNFTNGTMGNTDGATGAITGRGLLMFEVVGGAGSPSDLVIPNTVPDGNDTSGTVQSPLSGTTPLAQLMGLAQVSATTSGTDLKRIVKFSAGFHGSLLTPTNSSGNPNVSAAAETFTEMQLILRSFLGSAGNTITITDTSVIAP